MAFNEYNGITYMKDRNKFLDDKSGKGETATESKPISEHEKEGYTMHYIYVLACGVVSVREFASSNCLSMGSVIHIRYIEQLRGLKGDGQILYVLHYTINLPDYSDIIIEAKIRGFEIKEV